MHDKLNEDDGKSFHCGIYNHLLSSINIAS